jgi:hypothetical protein
MEKIYRNLEIEEKQAAYLMDVAEVMFLKKIVQHESL